MRDGAAAEYVAVRTDALAAKPVSVDHMHAEVLTRTSVDEATNKGVTRGYHLLAIPSNRLHTSADWALDAVLPGNGCSWVWSALRRCRWTPRRGKTRRSARNRCPRSGLPSGRTWPCASSLGSAWPAGRRGSRA